MIDRSPARPSFTVVRGDISQAAPGDDALKGAVIAIGNFEGVHRGHRAVIDVALARARALGRKAAVLTFEPHPRAVFKPDEPVFRLSDEAAKLRLLAMTGLDGAIVMRFDAALAGLSAEDFVQQILIERFAVAAVVVGFDFHFGRGRAGSPEFLAAAGRRHGFTVDIVPPFSDGGTRISSGAVRTALAAGEVEQAAGLLGYPWFVSGEVVHGDKRGRALGFPTANLRVDPAAGSSRAFMRSGSGSEQSASMAWRASAAGRCSTPAWCCSRSSCSISRATSMAGPSTSPSFTGSGPSLPSTRSRTWSGA